MSAPKQERKPQQRPNQFWPAVLAVAILTAQVGTDHHWNIWWYVPIGLAAFIFARMVTDA